MFSAQPLNHIANIIGYNLITKDNAHILPKDFITNWFARIKIFVVFKNKPLHTVMKPSYIIILY